MGEDGGVSFSEQFQGTAKSVSWQIKNKQPKNTTGVLQLCFAKMRFIWFLRRGTASTEVTIIEKWD